MTAPLIVNQTFSQTEFIIDKSGLAHIMNFHDKIISYWKMVLFNFGKKSFDSGFQKIVLPCLLLFSCACYWVDRDDIQWNEAATTAAINFNNSWLLYLHFSNMINLSSNILFIKNTKCHQFLFWKKNHQKSTIFLFFLKALIL